MKWRVSFTLVTDCNAFMMTTKNNQVPLRVARWALYMQNFDYKLEHRSESMLKHADALNRVLLFL